MTITTIDLTHPVRVVHDDRADSLGHRAECGCGWAGAWQLDQADAEADALGHREVAVGPGDGLDRVMGELLDMQDDLATMVVWLAENWSADLPVPVVYGGRGGSDGPARVDVSVCCGDAADLVRISHLMGVLPVDGDQAGRSRAVRTFGRVTLRAVGPQPKNEGAGS